MKTLVVGGDGFCGWPTSLHLANCGHDVLILDNLSRRQIDEQLGTQSLTPIHGIEQRVIVANNHFGSLRFEKCDTAKDVDLLRNIIH